MKNTGFLYLAVVILTVSCSKEKSLENGNGGGGGNSGELLVKVTTTGAQASTQDLSYDSKKLLTKYVVSATSSSLITASTYTITRDGEGRVTKIVQDVPANLGNPASSTPTSFFYLGPTDKKLKYGISVLDAGGGFIVRDSIVYEYTGTTATKASHYYSFDDGASYDLFTYTTFKYDARGNVTEQVSYADLGSGIEQIQSVTTDYDNKPNPCNFDDDAFLEQGMGAFLPTNNAIKQVISVPIASTTVTATGTYEYRSDGRPAKSNGNLMGAAYQAVFSYK